MSVLTEVIQAMKSLGECHLTQLYSVVKYPSDSIRKCLYTYSSDSKYYKGTKDIFKCVYGVDSRKGIWTLRDINEVFHNKAMGVTLNKKSLSKEKKEDINKILENFKNKSLPEFREGETIERKIMISKRNKVVVRLAKKRDNYTCQACGFNFYEKIIEAHHLLPLSLKDKEYSIKLEDLITLCPNCHSMAHYLLKEDVELYSNKEFLLDKLKELIVIHYN